MKERHSINYDWLLFILTCPEKTKLSSPYWSRSIFLYALFATLVRGLPSSEKKRGGNLATPIPGRLVDPLPSFSLRLLKTRVFKRFFFRYQVWTASLSALWHELLVMLEFPYLLSGVEGMEWPFPLKLGRLHQVGYVFFHVGFQMLIGILVLN